MFSLNTYEVFNIFDTFVIVSNFQKEKGTILVLAAGTILLGVLINTWHLLHLLLCLGTFFNM